MSSTFSQYNTTSYGIYLHSHFEALFSSIIRSAFELGAIGTLAQFILHSFHHQCIMCTPELAHTFAVSNNVPSSPIVPYVSYFHFDGTNNVYQQIISILFISNQHSGIALYWKR